MERKTPLILLVGPDLGPWMALRVVLRLRGARVLVARTIDQTLRIAREERPDLVVLTENFGDSGQTGLEAVVRSILGDDRVVLLPSDATAGGPGASRLSLKDHLELISTALPGGLESCPAFPPYLGRVLCVDDDPAYLDSLRRLLARRGYRVECFPDAEQALDAFQHFHPDLVILDMMMPGMSGLDLAVEVGLRSEGRIPVVFLTGLDTDETFYLGHQSGARHVLAKSGDLEELLSLVDSLAGGLVPPGREPLEAEL